MTLQQQYNLIKEGKGNKGQFLKHARSLFPEYFNQYTNYDNAISVLKSKQIISEGVGGVVGKGFDIWDWKKILAEETKAVEKEISKEAAEANKNAYDNSDMKNADNVNFNEIMKGFYTEMKDPKNADKTGDELKAMVVKNLAKDPLYYTKNGEFGTKGVGYTTEAPGLGEPKEPKGKHKSSGYGDLKENKEKRKLSLKLVDGKDKKGLALYKNTEDQDDLYYYDGKVLYSVVDGDKKGSSVRMSLYNITGLQGLEEQKLRSLIHNIIKEELDGTSDFDGVGLIVVGKSQIDNNAIADMLDETDFYGVWNSREGYWFFPEDEETLDSLERYLDEEFSKRGINARFESQI